MKLTSFSKVRLLSKVTLKLHVWVEGDREEFLTVRVKLCVDLVRDLRPMINEVTFVRKFKSIRAFSSGGQFDSVKGIVVVMELVLGHAL